MSISPPSWPPRTNQMRPGLTFWRNNYAMHSIMWLLGLLTLLFFAGMGLLSHLNLSYSQQAMHELRQEQIKDIVLSGLTRIDSRQAELQRHTVSLGNIGKSFYSLSRDSGVSRTALQAQLATSLHQFLADIDGISGGGIWFEPGVLADNRETFAIRFAREEGAKALTQMPPTGSARYRDQRWFDLTLGKDWTPDPSAGAAVSWSPVYFDFASGRAVLTLASPMYNEHGELIGVVTTDWSSDQIVTLVSHVEVTDSSFAFLNDRNNRNLSSLNQSADPRLEQKLIDGILEQHLSADAMPVTGAGSEALLNKQVLVVEGRTYELYYAATQAGLVYGAGVPREEIDQVLVPMRDSNYRILIATGTVLLFLSAYLLYRIVLLMRELQASYTDILTGLPNRVRLLKDAGDRAGACLIILNLDRFKEINSLFGNDCGDHVLTETAGKIRQFVKSRAGKPGGQFTVYRLAGDEFALLGPLLSELQVGELAARLVEFTRHERVFWHRQALSLDASAGIAFQPDVTPAPAPDHLLSQATIAVVQAREQMRHYLFYDHLQQVEKGYEQNLYWAGRLKDALEHDRLVPHFQPIHDNQSQRITKYECLVRMLDDEHSFITAGQFMGVAGKLRLNRQITRVMIEKSFAAFAREPYDFSINLSYPDIVDPEIMALILRHLRASAIGPRVIFEILESDGIDNYDAVYRFIEQIKPFGCQVAIDDFGTGYSNFSHLLKLNIDIIKIDGSLIRYLAQDHTALLVTRGIVQFARSLGIRTVAEFVQSDVVQARVLELGIDYSQGEYFSMPGPDLIQSPT